MTVLRFNKGVLSCQFKTETGHFGLKLKVLCILFYGVVLYEPSIKLAIILKNLNRN